MGPSDEALPQVQQIVGHVARRMKRGMSLKSWSIEDLEQEILRRLVQRWHRYDPNRGTELAFAQVVVTSVALMLLREARAQKRGLRVTTFTDLGGEPRGPSVRIPYNHADARSDIAMLMDLLEDDPDLREICILLSRDGPTQVARQTGRSRSVVYRCLQRVRDRAREQGFHY